MKSKVSKIVYHQHEFTDLLNLIILGCDKYIRQNFSTWISYCLSRLFNKSFLITFIANFLPSSLLLAKTTFP